MSETSYCFGVIVVSIELRPKFQVRSIRSFVDSNGKFKYVLCMSSLGTMRFKVPAPLAPHAESSVPTCLHLPFIR